MVTTENLIWFILIFGLIIAVATFIIAPILNKAGEANDEIDVIEFNTGSVSNHYNRSVDEFMEAVLDDDLRAA
ncbi:hypothetical protein [Geosporobacter ferrireducens]|uniref:Uncharacterized protein n=1 Tax=Geosporobacter ferrireducens TaxID=1424294 RepID=A0A1D8GBR0_9FIRM|nr:hypothetical protein [Geosporobacter ferrireducens]AOT68347.1 hypothetical protein Gferi_01305 [Geosporobacter ferrireducens]